MSDVFSFTEDDVFSFTEDKEVMRFIPQPDITVKELAEILASMNLHVTTPDIYDRFSEEARRHWSMRPMTFDYLKDEPRD